MNKGRIKAYAPTARNELIEAVAAKAQILGLSDKKIEPVEVKGDLAIIAGRPFPRQIAPLRRNLEQAVRREGFEQLVERIAFTWFNRFTALRYMELHGYLDHGYRVLSHPKGGNIPEILEHATDLDLAGLDKAKVAELRLAGSKDNELYRLLLVAQCNALNTALPFLFERTNDETELLLPDNLLHTDSPVRKLASEIEEEDWNDVEIVGWLYQFYISEKKDAVIGKVVKSQDIPAATQLFTPNWIVKYMTQNTLGRQWLATYPASAIKGKMEFYIEPAEQTEEVKTQLKAITPSELNPEEITFFDPACGSGHILVEAYDLFKQIYEERGYARRDIPRLILEKNLFGLDIDERAAQLAAFSLMMKARADDRSLFRAEPPVKLNIMAIKESNGLDIEQIAETLTREKIEVISGNTVPEQQTLAGFETKPIQKSLVAASKSEIDKATLITFLEFFKDAKTYGSLLRIPERFVSLLPTLHKLLDPAKGRDLAGHIAAEELRPFVIQTSILAVQYDNVVANPPYMGTRQGMNDLLKKFVEDTYVQSKTDLYSCFIERAFNFCRQFSFTGLVTMHSWMYLGSYEKFRSDVFWQNSLTHLLHLGAHAFEEISGEKVQVAAFVSQKVALNGISIFVDLTEEIDKSQAFLQKRSSLSYFTKKETFDAFEEKPLVYQILPNTIEKIKNAPLFRDVADSKIGLQTGNNERFIRFWHEVPFNEIHYFRQNSKGLNKKWFFHNKGGENVRWHFYPKHVVLWGNNGEAIRMEKARRLQNGEIEKKNSGCWNEEYYLRSGISYTRMGSGRLMCFYVPDGVMFDTAAPTIFPKKFSDEIVIQFLNSSVSRNFARFLNPTLSFQKGDLERIPVILPDSYPECDSIFKKITQICEKNESRCEIYPLFSFSACYSALAKCNGCLSKLFCDFNQDIRKDLEHLACIEKSIDEVFSKSYGFSSDDSDSHGSCSLIYPKDKHAFAKEFCSVAFGCMMGRYSLDKTGLVYANAENKDFDHSQYPTFPADDDGIVPVSDIDWFPDDATPRLVEFVKTVFGDETLDENLAWIAESFEPKKGEAPVETIRRYFSTQFFKNHLQMYKKRPIYWLFSSGKQKAFECLVYLHRYNESTLARMRAQYVTPLQGKLNARIEHLRRETDSAGSTAAKTKLRKEVEMLVKKQTELAKFDEELRHYSDQRIKLDLDDGVRVNYGKFGSLLAETKTITGGNDE